MPVPTTVITGFLGSGKTTAIRHLLSVKPPDEHWAVVVNEFGEIGIDAAVIAAAGGDVEVRDVAGGCICCTSAPLLRVAINRVLRTRRPDRLLIEPTGLGHPARIVDSLRDEWMRKALDLKGVICLVDPRQFAQRRYREHDVYADQLMLADVLVANKRDLATIEELAAFEAGARAMYPPKMVVAQVSGGRIEPAWLDLSASPDRALAHSGAHASTRAPSAPRIVIPLAAVAPTEPGAFLRREGAGLGERSCGWLFARDTWFDAPALSTLFAGFSGFSGGSIGGAPLHRAKGVFRIDRDWALFSWVDGTWDMEPVAWRRDSRFEVVVGDVGDADWPALEHRLLATVAGRGTGVTVASGAGD